MVQSGVIYCFHTDIYGLLPFWKQLRTPHSTYQDGGTDACIVSKDFAVVVPPVYFSSGDDGDV